MANMTGWNGFQNRSISNLVFKSMKYKYNLNLIPFCCGLPVDFILVSRVKADSVPTDNWYPFVTMTGRNPYTNFTFFPFLAIMITTTYSSHIWRQQSEWRFTTEVYWFASVPSVSATSLCARDHGLWVQFINCMGCLSNHGLTSFPRSPFSIICAAHSLYVTDMLASLPGGLVYQTRPFHLKLVTMQTSTLLKSLLSDQPAKRLPLPEG